MKGHMIGLLMICLGVVTGCAPVGPRLAPPDITAPGEVLTINRTLRIPADMTRVYFQDGEVRTARGITVWTHHCALFLEHGRHAPHRIDPGTEFVVADLQRKMDMGVWDRGVINYRTLLRFTEAAFPVRGMDCEIWRQGYAPVTFIDRQQWRRVLGAAVTIGGPE